MKRRISLTVFAVFAIVGTILFVTESSKKDDVPATGMSARPQGRSTANLGVVQEESHAQQDEILEVAIQRAMPKARSLLEDEPPHEEVARAEPGSFLTDAIQRAMPKARSLLEEWERSSFKGFDNTSELLSNDETSTSCLLLPPPDEETDQRLKELITAELMIIRSGGAHVLSDFEFQKAKEILQWPANSRVVVAQAKPDGTDAILLFDNATETDVVVDPGTGAVKITSESASLNQLNLESANRFSHLFQIDREQ